MRGCQSWFPLVSEAGHGHHVPLLGCIPSAFFAQRHAEDSSLRVLAARPACSGEDPGNDAARCPRVSVAPPLRVQVRLPPEAPGVCFARICADGPAHGPVDPREVYKLCRL